jgi:hypothetical protein
VSIDADSLRPGRDEWEAWPQWASQQEKALGSWGLREEKGPREGRWITESKILGLYVALREINSPQPPCFKGDGLVEYLIGQTQPWLCMGHWALPFRKPQMLAPGTTGEVTRLTVLQPQPG